MSLTEHSVTLADIRAAAARIAPYAHHTPVARCATLDAMAGAALYFKCENLQKVGAFKFRGATNAVFQLTDDEAARGVVTHSSGNHAAALALAARLRGIAARIVMPRNAPAVKKAATAGYGADITYCEPTLEAREHTTTRIISDHGCTFVHPYDDTRIIAGQGTAALELIEDIPDLDIVIAPVGGGGLLAGTALAVTDSYPNKCVFGAEPVAADDAKRSLDAGRIIPSDNPVTVADGLLTSLGDLTFPIIHDRVADILTVDDAATLAAMQLILQRMKLVVEPSAAVALAAVLTHSAHFAGKRVGVVLSGGNVELAPSS